MKTGWMLLTCTAVVAGPPGLAREPQQAAVTLKHVEPAEVVYTVHQGPYWELGKVFGEVKAYMTRHGQAGPMFSRYVDDPMKIESTKLRTEVGFFVEGDVAIEDGYQRKRLGAHEAATLLVEGRYGMSTGHHKTVLEWMASNGYGPAGEIMEIYPPRIGKQSIVEIRVPVLPDSETNIAIQRETRSFAELVSAKEYQAAAEILIPVGDGLPAIHRKWLIEVVDRLRVIRQIVDKKYGREAGEVDALVGPIVERGQHLRRESVVPHASAPSEASFAARNIAKQRADFLIELDGVMVRAHLKVLEADEVFNGLVTILTQVRSIVSWKSVEAGPSMSDEPAGKDSP